MPVVVFELNVEAMRNEEGALVDGLDVTVSAVTLSENLAKGVEIVHLKLNYQGDIRITGWVFFCVECIMKSVCVCRQTSQNQVFLCGKSEDETLLQFNSTYKVSL